MIWPQAPKETRVVYKVDQQVEINIDPVIGLWVEAIVVEDNGHMVVIKSLYNLLQTTFTHDKVRTINRYNMSFMQAMYAAKVEGYKIRSLNMSNIFYLRWQYGVWYNDMNSISTFDEDKVCADIRYHNHWQIVD